MLKRFVARLLIVLQIYGNLFQGVVHAADLAESYPIRNQIHLRLPAQLQSCQRPWGRQSTSKRAERLAW